MSGERSGGNWRAQPVSDAPPSLIALQQSLLQGMASMQQVMMDMKDRMDRLEGNVDKVQRAVVALCDADAHGAPSFHTSPAPRPIANDPPPLCFRLSPDVETMWYTDRPFPTFSLEIVEEHTGQVYTRADDWGIEIHLLDGYGRYVDQKLGQNDQARHVNTHKGVATIAALRFFAVSSKNGGTFTLEFELTSPREFAPRVAAVQSPAITVLSCRLFHCPKAPLHRLQPSDPLSKMPGIGRLYAQRFHAVGITSIAKLASLDLDAMGPQVQQRFIDALRKDKGTMTKVKLEDYIAQAREVLEREQDSPEEEPPAKRAKVAHQDHAVAMQMSNVGSIASDYSLAHAQPNAVPPSEGKHGQDDEDHDPAAGPTHPVDVEGTNGEGLGSAGANDFAIPDWGLRRGSVGSVARANDLGLDDLCMFEGVQSSGGGNGGGPHEPVPRTRQRRASSVSKYFAPSLLGPGDVVVRRRRSSSVTDLDASSVLSPP